jgi:hypothetical protein
MSFIRGKPGSPAIESQVCDRIMIAKRSLWSSLQTGLYKAAPEKNGK